MTKRFLVEKYLVAEKGLSGGLLIQVVEKIEKHKDIYDEFCYWLEKRNYEKENPVTVGGYTAKQVYELNPKLDGIGVYNFLITVRENPERAKEYIKTGFKEL